MSKANALMTKPISILAILLVIQIALAGWLFSRGTGFGTVQPDEPLFSFDPVMVDRVMIQDNAGAQVELVKRDDQWRLPAYFDFPATATKVEALLKDLRALRTHLPVSTSPEAFTRFKVADDQFERRIALLKGDTELARLYLGDSPGFKRLFARGAQAKAVYEVAYSTFQAGAKAGDWTDKALLSLPADQVLGFSLNGLELNKEKAGDQDRWMIKGETTEVDQAKAADLVRAVTNLSFLEVLGTEAKPDYGLDNPVVRLAIQVKDAPTRELLIGKAAVGEDYVLKAREQPWYLKLGDWAVKGLREASRETLVNPASNEPVAGLAPVEPPAAAADATAPSEDPEVPSTNPGTGGH